MKIQKTFKLSWLFLFMLIATQSCMVSSLHPLYTDKDRVYKEELCGIWQDREKTTYEITTVVDSTASSFFRDYPLGTNSERQKKQSLYQHLITSIDSAKYISNKRNQFKIDATKSRGKQNAQETEQLKTKMKTRLSNLLDKDLKHPKNQYYQIKIIQKKDTCIFEGRLAKLNNSYFLDIIPDDHHLEKRLNNDNLIGLVTPMHGFLKLQLIDDTIKLNWIEVEDLEKLRKEKKIRLNILQQNDREIITTKTSDIQKFLIKFANSDLFTNKNAELVLTPLK